MTTYRVGRHQPQNVYRDDQYIGVMFTAEDAQQVVAALNQRERQAQVVAGPCEDTIRLMAGVAPLRCELRSGHIGDHEADGARWWRNTAPHPTCVDVSNLRAGKPPGTEWVCGPDCPKPDADTSWVEVDGP